MSTEVEKLVALLEVRSREFERQLDRAARITDRRAGQIEDRFKRTNVNATAQMQSMGVKIAGILGGITGFGVGMLSTAGLSSFVRSAVNELNTLGKNARAVGIDVEDLQGLIRGFERGTTATGEQAMQAFTDFAQRVGQAARGTGELKIITDRYGISLRDQNGQLRSQSELLGDIADAISNAGSESERLDIAAAAFGEAGRKMVEGFAGGSAGLRTMITDAREAGTVIDRDITERAERLADRFDDLTRKAATFFKEIAVGAGGAVLGIETTGDVMERLFQSEAAARAALGDQFDGLTGATADVEGLADALDSVAASWVETIANARATSDALADVVWQMDNLGHGAAAESLRDVALWLNESAYALEQGGINAEEFDRRVRNAADRVGDLVSEVDKLNGASLVGITSRFGDLFRSITANIGAVQALKDEAAGATTSESGIVINTPGPNTPRPRNAPRDIDFGLPPVARGGGGGGGGGASRDGYARAVEQIREQTAALESEAIALIAAAAGGRELGMAYTYAMQKAKLLTEAQKQGLTVTPELEAEVDALAMAYARAGMEAGVAADRLKQMEDSAKAGADAMADLFLGLMGGASSAKQALAGLLQQIARVQMTRAFDMLGSGGGFLGMLGGLLTGKRAGGGSVAAGGAYLVNENTPRSEVFVPSRSGAILNVPQAQAALRQQAGGGSVAAGGAYLVNENTPRSEVFVPSRYDAILNVPQAQAALRQQAGGGVVRIVIDEAPGFAARVRTEAQGVAVQVIRASEATLPARMADAQERYL